MITGAAGSLRVGLTCGNGRNTKGKGYNVTVEQWVAAIIPLLTAIGAFLHSVQTRRQVNGKGGK